MTYYENFQVAKMNACGILFCYNEQHILPETLKHYLKQGIDLVIVDNYSTDASLDIVKTFQKDSQQYPIQILDVLRIKTEKYEWQKILHFACDYMHHHLNHYRWIWLIDADSFYDSPVKGTSLLEFIDIAERHGYNILNGQVFDFFPTEKDDPRISSSLDRMKYCKVNYYWNVSHQHKIFRYHPTVNFYSTGGHICYRENPRICPVEFIYRHYPWVSYEHGVKKLFEERKPRYVERKDHPTWHYHHLDLLPIRKDLVKQSKDLWYFQREKIFLPHPLFLAIMKLRFPGYLRLGLYSAQYIRHSLGAMAEYIKTAPRTIKNLWQTISYNHLSKTARLLTGELKIALATVKRNSQYTEAKGATDTLKQLALTALSYKALIWQKPFTFGFPNTYHFLMTDYCNAQCTFCNQNYSSYPQSKKEITFDKFKAMISNIPMHTVRNFHFSGGGEPLLCHDLWSMIEYVNTLFPWVNVHIRTNGLLLKKYAKELSGLNIFRLGVSVHGDEEINNAVIQRKNSRDIFEGIAIINDFAKQSKKRMRTVFWPTVNRSNIYEIPKLIQKASALNVDSVVVSFCRYYIYTDKKRKSTANIEDSLYFHKEIYNQVIRESRKQAKSLGIYFEDEGLFFHKPRQRSCFLPWKLVLVDWDGDIYPCVGGEIWFDKKVKSGVYYFGNVLKEHVYQWWNNDSYIMIRRTLNRNYNEEFIPECRTCCNTICYYGPDKKEGHILIIPK